MSETDPAMIVEMGKKYCYGPWNNPMPVRILCTDAPGTHSVVAISPDGGVTMRTLDGAAVPGIITPLLDLRQDLPRYRREFWVNIYLPGKEPTANVVFVYSSQKTANEYANPGRIACHHVILEGEEGEGLT